MGERIPFDCFRIEHLCGRCRDGSSKMFHAGKMSRANKDTMDWHRNDGKYEVLLVAVDVLHPANSTLKPLSAATPTHLLSVGDTHS